MALRAIHSAPIENYRGPPQSIGALPPRRKQRILDKYKCDACRTSKQKCFPQGRSWPGQKCQRCTEKHLPCSAPAKKERVVSRRSAVSCSPDGSLPPSFQDVEHTTPMVTIPTHDNVANSSGLVDANLVGVHTEANHQSPSVRRNSAPTHANLAQTAHLGLPQEGPTSPLAIQQSQPWMDEATSFPQQIVDTVENGEDWGDTCESAYDWVRNQPQSADLLKYLHSMDHYVFKALLEEVFGLAIDKGDVSIVEQLLAAGRNPKHIAGSRSGPRTALQRACDCRNRRIVDALLRAGADPNETPVPSHNEKDSNDEDGDELGFLPPLSYLLFDCEPDNYNVFSIARILLDKGADINGGRITPLSLAAENGDVRMVRFLLANGANVKFSSPRDGRTALSSILDSRREISIDIATEIVEVLVGAGADIKDCFPTMVHGYHCYLDMAVDRISPKFVQFLLAHGARPCQYALKRCLHMQSDEPYFAVEYRDSAKIIAESGCWVDGDLIKLAAEHSGPALVILLLDRHGDYNLRQRYEQIAFTTALLHGRNDLAAQLANRDAHLNGGDQLTRAIERAAVRGDKQLISLLFDQQSPYRQTAIGCMGESLSVAILKGPEAVAEILLEASLSSDSSASRPNARSLWAALKRGKASLARRLLRAGAPVISVTKGRMTGEAQFEDVRSVLPVVAHGKSGDISFARGLIAAGADIDAPGFDDDDPEPALVAAIRGGRWELVRILIDAGADVNLKGLTAKATSRTPLQAAVETGNVALVEYLLLVGADPEDEGALCEAVSRSTLGSHGLFTALIDALRNRRRRPWKLFGRRVLQRAIRKLDSTIVDLILISKVDLDSVVYHGPDQLDQYPDRRVSCFGTAITYDRAPGYPIVNTLLRAGANPNGITIGSSEPQSSMTALMQAIARGSPELANLLIKSGAEVNMNNPISTLLQRSPLQLAVEVGNYEMVKLLLDNSANVNEAAAEYHGATALQLAARKENLNITRLLLDHGADIIAPPASVGGKAALEEAAERGNLPIILLFLRSGVEIPLDQYRQGAVLARKKGHTLIFHLLESSARGVQVLLSNTFIALA